VPRPFAFSLAKVWDAAHAFYSGFGAGDCACAPGFSAPQVKPLVPQPALAPVRQAT